MSKKVNKVTKAEVKEAVKQAGVQVHFGNVKMVELRLLEQIAKNTADIVKILSKVNEE